MEFSRRRLSQRRACVENMELDHVDEALQALIASCAANYGDGASMERPYQAQSRLRSFVTRATAAFEVCEE
jgi:hypothetical protein